MTIRDDRRAFKFADGPDGAGEVLRRRQLLGRAGGEPEAAHFAPDAVLYDCPECGRSHFVRVGECPGQSEAAAETARADRKAA